MKVLERVLEKRIICQVSIQIIYFLYLLYTEIRPYFWHRFLFIRFYILITCKFICTGNEYQLKNMDNTFLYCKLI